MLIIKNKDSKWPSGVIPIASLNCAWKHPDNLKLKNAGWMAALKGGWTWHLPQLYLGTRILLISDLHSFVCVPVLLTIELSLQLYSYTFIFLSPFVSKMLCRSLYTVRVFVERLWDAEDCPGCHVTAGVLFVSCGPLLTKTALLWEASCCASLWHMQTVTHTHINTHTCTNSSLVWPFPLVLSNQTTVGVTCPSQKWNIQYMLKYDISIRWTHYKKW